MRYPEGHKEAIRAKIVEQASRLLRRDGLDGVSIPALMKEVGLTHGGFYAHFASRDELVAEAVTAAAEATGAAVLSSDRGAGTAAVLEAYLSEEHVARPEIGCVLAALGTEGHRQPAAVRRAFARAARGFLRLVQERLHRKSPPGHLSDDALSLAATMVGAVVLARLVDDDALAARILSAAKKRG